MRLVFSTLVRALLYASAVMLSLLASLVLVRKLTPADYAAYQAIVKRLPNVAYFFQSLYHIWVYRYLARGIAEAAAAGVTASLTVSLPTALLGFVTALKLTSSLLLAFAASVALILIVVWPIASLIIDAVRPLRSALLVLLVRVAYGGLVVITVYFMHLGLTGAFAAITVAYTAGILLAARWTQEIVYWRPRSIRQVFRLIREWLRKAYSMLPISVSMLLAPLDVAVGYAAYGAGLVAGFFAITNPFSIVSEILGKSFQYFHSYILATGETGAAVRATRLALFIAAPLIVYAAMYPKYYIYIINPVYSWASRAAPLAAYTGLLMVATTSLVYIAYGLINEGGPAEARKLAYVNVGYYLLPQVAYLALLGFLLLLLHPSGLEVALIAWEASFFAAAVTRFFAMLLVVSKQSTRGFINDVVIGLIMYPLLAAFVSLLAAPSAPPTRSIIHDVLLLAPRIIEVYAVYTSVLLVVDGFVRDVALRVLRRLF